MGISRNVFIADVLASGASCSGLETAWRLDHLAASPFSPLQIAPRREPSTLDLWAQSGQEKRLGRKLINSLRFFTCHDSRLPNEGASTTGRRYELTDHEWSILSPLLPNKPRDVPRVDDRRVMNGILWRFRTGSPWTEIPERYGPSTTCYNRFVRWRKAESGIGFLKRFRRLTMATSS